MNINKEYLNKLRLELDNEYDNLENEINKLYVKNKNDKKIKSKEEKQELIDQQIDLIDNIIFSLDNVPRMYENLLKLNEEYKKA